MKKFLSMVLALALVLGMTTAMAADTITTNGGTKTADVKVGEVVYTNVDKYSVTISWGAMNFNYAATKEWDPNTFNWKLSDEVGTWTADNSSNTITVANSSSKAITATCAFSEKDSAGLVSASFKAGGTDLVGALTVAAPTVGATQAVSEVITVELTALKNAEVTESSTLGTITVTIAAAN